MDEVAPGLYYWTAPHPAWEPDPEPESPADWPQHVGSAAYAAPTSLVLVDPLVEAWEALDALVERHGKPVAVLTTMRFHSRSRAAVAERYDGTLVSVRDDPPEGVERIAIEGGDETMVWLPAPRALVPGDRLLGTGGGLRMCPESWLRYLPTGLEELRAGLRPLLELPVDLVLASHGEPVLRDGRAAIAAALA
jgi:hypothetical protein